MPDNPRDPRWFAARLPRPDVLTNILSDDRSTEHLLGVTRSRAIVEPGVAIRPRTDADEEEVRAMLQLAKRAARRLSDDPRARLSAAEMDALDLFIILVSRPAIFVRNGKVPERPENWPEVQREEELLPRVIAGVGRIEVASRQGIGTGFIAGERRILTNNHVVCGLIGLGDRPGAWQKKDRATFDRAVAARNEWWTDHPDARPWFELYGEFGSSATSTARITRVLGSHKEVDMAVLELDEDPPQAARLELATEEPNPFKRLPIYAVGYPTADLGVTPAPLPILRRVFGQDESLGTKRFSPGEILGWKGTYEFHHDASTLAGSSGSCIVDFNEHCVIGLHYSGVYRTENRAVPLWKFRDDDVLTKHGVVFG